MVELGEFVLRSDVEWPVRFEERCREAFDPYIAASACPDAAADAVADFLDSVIAARFSEHCIECSYVETDKASRALSVFELVVDEVGLWRDIAAAAKDHFDFVDHVSLQPFLAS